MFRVFFQNKFNYSIEPLLSLRQSTSAKICYRHDLTFLKYGKTLTQSISNRFVINSNYYRSYKNLRRCYINMLRANFCSRTPSSLKLWELNNFDNKNFFVLYEKAELTLFDVFNIHLRRTKCKPWGKRLRYTAKDIKFCWCRVFCCCC